MHDAYVYVCMWTAAKCVFIHARYTFMHVYMHACIHICMYVSTHTWYMHITIYGLDMTCEFDYRLGHAYNTHTHQFIYRALHSFETDQLTRWQSTATHIDARIHLHTRESKHTNICWWIYAWMDAYTHTSKTADTSSLVAQNQSFCMCVSPSGNGRPCASHM
jgi:hypothetical protein